MSLARNARSWHIPSLPPSIRYRPQRHRPPGATLIACAASVSLFAAMEQVAQAASQEEVAAFVLDWVVQQPSYEGLSIRITKTAVPSGREPRNRPVVRDIHPEIEDYPLPFERTWVVMIDDLPHANWGHDCRWVLVEENPRNGELTGQFIVLDEKNFPPTVLLDGGWGPSVPLDCIEIPALQLECDFDGPPPEDFEFGDGGLAADKDCLYAILICGGFNDKAERFQSNLRRMYKRLRSLGYAKNRIWVYYADGSPLDLDNADGDSNDTTGSDVDGACSKQAVRNRISFLSSGLNPAKDTLFIYMTGHGVRAGAGPCDWGRSGVTLWDANGNKKLDAEDCYSPTELAADTKNAKVRRLLLIADHCFSGLFAPVASDGDHQVMAVSTAATADCYSWDSQYMDHWMGLDPTKKTFAEMHPKSLPGVNPPRGGSRCPCTGGQGATVYSEGKKGNGNLTLDRCGGDLPDNDTCEKAKVVGDGQTQFTINGATTDGPEHDAAPCDLWGYKSWDSDVWFSYTASCNGTLTISTCNLVNFDSRIGLYSKCPANGGTLVACAEDSDGCGKTSLLVRECVTAGTVYKIRVAGYKNSIGHGKIDISCVPFPGCSCLGDLDGNALIDGADLGILLGAWGYNPESPADLDGDGLVAGADLAELLARWGPCGP